MGEGGGDMPCMFLVYTVELDAKHLHPWIQERLEESGNYSDRGWGELTFKAINSKYMSKLQFIS